MYVRFEIRGWRGSLFTPDMFLEAILRSPKYRHIGGIDVGGHRDEYFEVVATDPNHAIRYLEKIGKVQIIPKDEINSWLESIPVP